MIYKMKKYSLMLLFLAFTFPHSAHARDFTINTIEEKAKLPAGVAEILTTAAKSGDQNRFQIILETLQATYPDAAIDITLKANEIAPKWLSAQSVKQAQYEKAVIVSQKLAEQRKKDKQLFNAKLWNLQAELGAGITSGDTKETSIAAGISMQRAFGKTWEHIIDVNYDLNRSEGVTNRKRYLAKYDALWKPWNKAFVLNHMEINLDEFSGFDYQIIETLGLGYKLFDTDTLKVRLDAGPGFRMTKYLDEVGRDTEFLGRAAGNIFWKIHKNLTLQDRISYSMAQRSNVFENTAELNATINSSLAARLSFEVRYDSIDIEDTSKWDTISRITLVYNF